LDHVNVFVRITFVFALVIKSNNVLQLIFILNIYVENKYVINEFKQTSGKSKAKK